MPDLVAVRRALISVSDKTGLVEFARAISERGIVIVSTGGTAKTLAAANIPVTPVETLTGFPEMMDGRVKTLHPKVHGGLLAVRDNPEHADAMRKHGIEPIDLVVINLYPFRQTVARSGVSFAEAVENVDIGGPAMVRSAAKNHAWVAVVTDPSQYARVLDDLRDSGGRTTLRVRTELAAAAFQHTAEYDGAIAGYLASQTRGAREQLVDPARFPEHLTLRYTKTQSLRYGENPHQEAAVYRDPSYSGPSIVLSEQLHGKELSYNNIHDAAAALDLVLGLADSARSANKGASACVIKHANPCGAAVAADAREAVDRAIAGDPLAAFGGILACSAVIRVSTARRLIEKDVFLEVLLAPGFEPAALELLRQKSQNIRLLAFGEKQSADGRVQTSLKSVRGGLLVQETDTLAPAPEQWVQRAGPKPQPATLAAAAMLEITVRAMASNAIAIGGGDGDSIRLYGGGVGQVDRVTACRLAVEKARSAARVVPAGAVAVSDAFFPFPDGPQVLIDAGVSTIVHPGGSKRDDETFALCEKHGVTCLTTGVRRFRH